MQNNQKQTMRFTCRLKLVYDMSKVELPDARLSQDPTLQKNGSFLQLRITVT